MKPSAVAVALLAAPLGAANAQQAVAAASYKKMSQLRGADLSSSPRTTGGGGSSNQRPLLTGGDEEAELLAKCTALPEMGDCDADESCAWCVAGAVPSACYPAMMTSMLPEGVFECNKKNPSAALPTSVGSVGEELAKAIFEDLDLVEEEEPLLKKRVQTFNLKEGITLTLSAGEVDPNFCDASSNLSMAGYMNVKGSQFDTKNDKELFFWFFEKRTTSQLPSNNSNGNPTLETGDGETPLVIWLTGGPGCSSSLALLTENGPCSVEADGASTKVNPHSWTESAHVLWLDQPANVGYSYGQGNDTNEEMISEDAYYFLQAWLQSEQGSKYKDAPLFIVGESYGGHYAPAISHRIWMGNKTEQEGHLKLNLKGLAVGNGLTDPEEQYKWYAEMGHNNSHNIEIFNDKEYKMMKAAEPMCTKGISTCNAGEGMLNSFACQTSFLYCNTVLTTPYRATGKNPYDITKPCGLNPLCYDFSHIEKFMNNDATKKALHVDEHNPEWATCNMMINMKFHVDWMKDFSPYVADMLNDGIPALIYAGDLDFVCNYMGNRAWTLGLDWDHKAEFNAAEEKDWNGGGGLARTSNNLTFLQVYDAGHMVPSDQPEQALTMITQFLNGQAFA